MVMTMMAAAALSATGLHLSAHSCWHYRQMPGISSTKASITRRLSSGDIRNSSGEHIEFPIMACDGNRGKHDLQKSRRKQVMYPDISPATLRVECLEAWEDEYGGIVIDPYTLPSTVNAFASALRASLSIWKFKGKKGIWLKILLQQADLIPIAIQEGFDYHHAEPGYVMLTHWIPDEPCMLPATPSHHIGVAAFVINHKTEVLVVKEKCPFSCSGVWKMPTGYINKSEDIFSGAIREVKEETGIDTIFLKLVAFRHAHQVAFDKSDLLFVCMLKPLSNEITIDEKEIQAAKWMAVDEVMRQAFYEEDEMSKRVMESCVAAYEDQYNGFTAHHLTSKLDANLSYLYYDHLSSFSNF